MSDRKIEITHETRIINVGHLQGHTMGKEKLLKEAGFKNIESLLFTKVGVEKLKETLKGSKDTLFLVGGAMMKGFPKEMAEVLEFVKIEAPDVFVYTTTAADFPPGTAFPPSEEIVNQSAVTICKKLLKKN